MPAPSARSARACLPALLAAAILGAFTPAASACTEEDISVRLVDAGFVNTCRDTPCLTLRGEGVIVNRCAEPIGVRVRLVGLDRDGEFVAAGEMWPFSRRNLAPGEHRFTIDNWFGDHPTIERFSLTVTQVVRWP